MRYIHLRLTQKPVERLHGLDLSSASVGDIVVVTPHSARLLIAAGCAVEEPSCIHLVARQLRKHALIRTPDRGLVGLCPSPGDLQRDRILAETQAVRVRHDTQQVAAALGRNQHITIRWGFGHRDAEPAGSRTMPGRACNVPLLAVSVSGTM